MEPVYDVDYFIRKFEAIPEEKWTTGDYKDGEGNYCALGHCGGMEYEPLTKEAIILNKIFLNNSLNIVLINDFKDQGYQQPTPKQRILAALYDIKANQMLEVAKEIIENPQHQPNNEFV